MTVERSPAVHWRLNAWRYRLKPTEHQLKQLALQTERRKTLQPKSIVLYQAPAATVEKSEVA